MDTFEFDLDDDDPRVDTFRIVPDKRIGIIWLLTSRRTNGLDEDDNIDHVSKENFSTAWNIYKHEFFVPSHIDRVWRKTFWKTMECGCTKNILTRRYTLYLWGCEKHLPNPSFEPLRKDSHE